MRTSKAARLIGFVGALCASGALVGFAVSGTGAYFTDSHGGEIDAGTGSVTVAISPTDGKLHFDNLLPGEYQDDNLNYEATGTGAEDIWLVFPTDGSAEAFVGNPSDGRGGGLGRFGHFALSSTDGAHFTSYNLNNPGTGASSGSSCPTDASTGWGGSNQQPTSPTDTQVPFCAPPNAILLASNLTNGQSGTATFEFGFTPLLKSGQNAADTKVVNYSIVATQHGIRPDDPFNG